MQSGTQRFNVFSPLRFLRLPGLRWFRELRIASKLHASFAVVLGLTVFLGLFSLTQLEKVNHTSTELQDHWMPGTRVLLELKASLIQLRAEELEHILAADDVKMRTHEKRMGELLDKIAAARQEYERLPSLPEEKGIYIEFAKLWDEYKTEHDNVVKLSGENKKNEAIIFNRGPLARVYGELREHIEQLAKINIDGSAVASRTGVEVYRHSQVWVAVMLGGAITLGLLFAFTIARTIARPLQEAVRIARRVADGDLQVEIEAASRDETGQLLEALKDMNSSLTRIVTQVRAGSETIAMSCAEIVNGNQDLSYRTEQQAASLQETASSMEEMTSTVTQNAENAKQANRLAAAASEVAVKGGKVVSDVVKTMDGISESARKIVDIIGVIDSIAFQTNILALNAAVEAARAGEQGRGFAVVAAEVRNLAQRAAGAAHEIKALIDNSVERVEVGTRLVGQAGSTIAEVVESVQRVGAIVAEISAASQEQSLGIQDINKAVAEMDQMTQQNAAMVEEAAAAAGTLQNQAGQMVELVRVFKLRDEDGGAARPEAAPVLPFQPPPRQRAAGRRSLRLSAASQA
jgi:methyl-accepting chemotaxis protein